MGSNFACRPRNPETLAEPAETTTAEDTALPLRVVTLDDPELSRALEREWRANAQAPCEFTARSSDTLASDPLHADVVVFPTALLGQLVTGRQIVPWPSSASHDDLTARDAPSRDDDYDWNDVFPWLRRRELRWGNELYGVSFGSPQLLLLFRADLLSEWGLCRPPRGRNTANLSRLLSNGWPRRLTTSCDSQLWSR